MPYQQKIFTTKKSQLITPDSVDISLKTIEEAFKKGFISKKDKQGMLQHIAAKA